MKISAEFRDYLKVYYLPRKGNSSVGGTIVPDTTDAYNLGSSSKRFDTIYARVVIADSLSGGATSDTVDGFHAYSVPNPSALLALGEDGVFPATVYPLALLKDGSRALEADLVVNSGVKIDGVDISLHAADYTKHHNSGMSADDHSQYVHNTSARTISAVHTFAPPAPGVPFTLHANAQGQTVTGLKADQLNKSISAGNGLSGGGALTADRTLSVNMGYSFAWTAQHSFSPGSVMAPFTLGANAQGQLVTGLNADQADGYHFDQDVRKAATPQFANVYIPRSANQGVKMGAYGMFFEAANSVGARGVGGVHLSANMAWDPVDARYEFINGTSYSGRALVLSLTSVGFSMDVARDAVLAGDPCTFDEVFKVATDGDVTIGSLAMESPTYLYIRSQAGQYRSILFQTDALIRWRVSVSSSAETGSDVGSNFEIARYADDGTLLGSALVINRASGKIGTNGVTSPAGHIHIRASGIAGAGETVAYFDVADATTGYVSITNASTTDAVFSPILRGRNSTAGNGPALIVEGNALAGDDVGNANALVVIRGAIANIASTSRPVLTVSNWTTPLFNIYPTKAELKLLLEQDGDIKFIGDQALTGTGKITVNPTTDVDITPGGDAYIQNEDATNNIYLGGAGASSLINLYMRGGGVSHRFYASTNGMLYTLPQGTWNINTSTDDAVSKVVVHNNSGNTILQATGDRKVLVYNQLGVAGDPGTYAFKVTGNASVTTGLDVGSPGTAAGTGDVFLSGKLRTSTIDSDSGTALTIQPAQTLNFAPVGGVVKAMSNVHLQSDGYASQTTGWRVSYAGEADFRYVYANEMHVKAFITDLEQALAGGQIITKSVAKVARDFTLPTAGNSGTLWVEEFAGFIGAVFQDGDIVRLRQISRTAGALTVSDAWGTVTYASRDATYNPAQQSYTFVRSAAPNAGTATGTILTGTLALDYGQANGGYHEVTAVDGAWGSNAPYSQVVTWSTHPAAGLSVRTRMGNLLGLSLPNNNSNEYGLYAGDGTADANKYIRVSNQAIEGHNLPVKLYSGSTAVISLVPGTSPYFSIGNPAPTDFLNQTGVWAGLNSSVYKMHIGSVSGGALVRGLAWDGTNLTVKGNVTVGDGNVSYGLNVGDALHVFRFNGPLPYNTDFSGNFMSHRGLEPKNATYASGVIGSLVFRPGKFGKGYQSALSMTNLVKNPKFANGTFGWATDTINGNSIATFTRWSWIGTTCLEAVIGGVSSQGLFTHSLDGWMPVTAGTVYTLSFRVRKADGSAVTTEDITDIWMEDHAAGVRGIYKDYGGWYQVVSNAYTAIGTQLSLMIYCGLNRTLYFDGFQVEALSYPSPYCDGDMPGHTWTGTANASSSTRPSSYLTYANSNVPVREGTVLLRYTPASWINDGVTHPLFHLNGYARGSLQIFKYLDGKFYIRMYNDGDANNPTGISSAQATVYNPGDDIFIAATWVNGGVFACRVYVNGVLIHDRNSGSTLVNMVGPFFTGQLTIGAGYSSGYANGVIDEVAILPRALTGNEIQAIVDGNLPIDYNDSNNDLFLKDNLVPGYVRGSAWGLFGYSSTSFAAGTGVFALTTGDITLEGAFGSQVMGAGDLLLGSVASSSNNLYFDASAGTLALRTNTTNKILLAATGEVTIGDATTENVYITSTSVQMRDGTTVYTDLTGGALTLGLSTGKHVLINTSSVSLMDNTTVYGVFAATTTIGNTAGTHAYITSTNFQMKNGSSVYADLTSGGVLTLGLSTDEHVTVDSNGVKLFDGTTVYGQFAATTTIGVTTGPYVKITSAGVWLMTSTTSHIQLQSDGDAYFGTNADDVTGITLAIFNNAQTYNSESVGVGDVLLGSNATGKANLFWDASAGALYLRNATTNVISLFATANTQGQIASFNGVIGIGSSGGIYQGTGTFTMPTTGLKIWAENVSGNYIGRIAGYNAGTLQWYCNTSGVLMAGSGTVMLDANGISVAVNTTFTDWAQAISYNFKDQNGNVIGYTSMDRYGGSETLHLRTIAQTGIGSSIDLWSECASGYDSLIHLSCATGLSSQISMRSNSSVSSISMYTNTVLIEPIGYAMDHNPDASMTIRGALTVDASLSAGGDISATGGVTGSTYVQASGPLYIRQNLAGLNKAANAWLAILTRDTSGSDAMWNMDYILNAWIKNVYVGYAGSQLASGVDANPYTTTTWTCPSTYHKGVFLTIISYLQNDTNKHGTVVVVTNHGYYYVGSGGDMPGGAYQSRVGITVLANLNSENTTPTVGVYRGSYDTYKIQLTNMPQPGTGSSVRYTFWSLDRANG